MSFFQITQNILSQKWNKHDSVVVEAKNREKNIEKFDRDIAS